MIHIILFISSDAGVGGGMLLERMILDNFTDHEKTICRTLEQLERNLRKPVSTLQERRICILLAETPSRLKELVHLMEDFDDMETVLILPDDTYATFSTGARLRPRFTVSKDQGFDALLAVLQKMIGRTITGKRPTYTHRSALHRKGLSL
ncbi:MAG: hypothetical protein AB1547_01665 [Thermodesulfobacteriota bacterium]